MAEARRAARPPTLYLDYNATTPLDPVVRGVLTEALDRSWGNASSVHHVGRDARARLDEARESVARTLGCKPSEIVFTSGGTEANNLAVFGAARARKDTGRHLICSSIEHPAVLHCFQTLERREEFSLTVLPVDSSGQVAIDDVERAIRPDTILVSVMAANNETGVLQPVPAIGELCRKRGIAFHTDAVQCFGKEPFVNVRQFEADLVAVCAHKLHGPKGIGLLYVRSPLQLEPLILGGGHEQERRAGTENLPAILALESALTRFVLQPVFQRAVLEPWADRIAALLNSLPGVSVAGGGVRRLSNTLAFTVAGTDSIALLANLDMAGICASSGSACSSGSVTPSHVLRAMGYPPALAASLVRLSLGRENTGTEIDAVCDLLPQLIRRAQGTFLSQ